jgi:hypothetical protein
LRDSSGDVQALLDVEATTTLTVRARWVQTSGTEEEKTASFPDFVPEDHPYDAGDVFKFTFAAPVVTRLFEVKADMNLSQNPEPTGLDNDPNYIPFAPLSTAVGYDDSAVLDRLDDVETDLTFVEQEVTDLQNDLDTKADLVTGKVPLAQLAFGSDAAAGIIRPQRGLRVSFGGRVSVRSQHYWDETEVNATSGDVFAVDAAYHITAYNPGFTLASEADAGTLAARIGSLVALRSDVFVNIPLGTLPGGVPKLINGTGNGLLYLQPNEWVLLRYTATGYDVLQRGSTAAPGAGAGSGNLLKFDESRDYGEITSGTYTVDATGMRFGVEVKAFLGAGCTAIALDPALFEWLGGAFVAGQKHFYMFAVSRNNMIQYVIKQRP